MFSNALSVFEGEVVLQQAKESTHEEIVKMLELQGVLISRSQLRALVNKFLEEQ